MTVYRYAVCLTYTRPLLQPKLVPYFKKILSFAAYIIVNSSVGTATPYGLDGPGIESRWGQDFACCPDRHWGPPSLLYDGHQSFLAIKLPQPDADHPNISSAEVANGSEQHLRLPSVPVAACHGVTFWYSPWFTASPPRMKNEQIFKKLFSCRRIQGVTGGMDQTSGGCSLC